jgi:hypothetical protein
MISATTLQAAASTQFPPAVAIPAHSTIQCPCRGTHHIQAPSPLAQASVGVFSPCGKNKQENCRFLWDLQPRRPGKRARSHHPALHCASARARTRARPAATITSTHTSTTSLTPLVQLTSAHALLALHHARDFALRRAPAVLLRPSPLSRWVHPCPHNSSSCAGPFTPYTRADPTSAPAWRLLGASYPPAFSCFGCVGPGAIFATPPPSPRRHSRGCLSSNRRWCVLSLCSFSHPQRYHSISSTNTPCRLSNCCPRSHVVIARPPTPPSSPLPFPVPKL